MVTGEEQQKCRKKEKYHEKNYKMVSLPKCVERPSKTIGDGSLHICNFFSAK
jgi:hypothetical protein